MTTLEDQLRDMATDIVFRVLDSTGQTDKLGDDEIENIVEEKVAEYKDIIGFMKD